jgi:hypothetical protein
MLAIHGNSNWAIWVIANSPDIIPRLSNLSATALLVAMIAVKPDSRQQSRNFVLKHLPSPQSSNAYRQYYACQLYVAMAG